MPMSLGAVGSVIFFIQIGVGLQGKYLQCLYWLSKKDAMVAVLVKHEIFLRFDSTRKRCLCVA